MISVLRQSIRLKNVMCLHVHKALMVNWISVALKEVSEIILEFQCMQLQIEAASYTSGFCKECSKLLNKKCCSYKFQAE
jgi:hypothetical protein